MEVTIPTFDFLAYVNSPSQKRSPYRRIATWNSEQPIFNGGFSWMIPNLYIKNGWKSPIPSIQKPVVLRVPGRYLFRNFYRGVSKNRGKTPKMDGENHGKPYEQMDDLGRKTHYFRKHP